MYIYHVWNSPFLLFAISIYKSIISYETDRSAISLRVPANTRTKPTDPPPRGKLGKKMSKWRLPIRYICDLFVKQTPTLLSWPICTSMDWMLIITPRKRKTKTLSGPIPTRPAGSVGTGWNETAGRATTFT